MFYEVRHTDLSVVQSHSDITLPLDNKTVASATAASLISTVAGYPVRRYSLPIYDDDPNWLAHSSIRSRAVYKPPKPP
jgi:uncharacterized protein (DUF427 family)